MAVCFTNENIHVQFIDDDAGVTLAAASTLSKTAPNRDKAGGERDQRQNHRRARGESALGKGIKEVVLTVAARVITARSRRWPMRRAKRD
jgi:ribosomal protein L18